MALEESGGLPSGVGADISPRRIHGAHQASGCCVELKQPDGLYQCCTN